VSGLASARFAAASPGGFSALAVTFTTAFSRLPLVDAVPLTFCCRGLPSAPFSTVETNGSGWPASKEVLNSVASAAAIAASAGRGAAGAARAETGRHTDITSAVAPAAEDQRRPVGRDPRSHGRPSVVFVGLIIEPFAAASATDLASRAARGRAPRCGHITQPGEPAVNVVTHLERADRTAHPGA
jgi:hypothetical protein